MIDINPNLSWKISHIITEAINAISDEVNMNHNQNPKSNSEREREIEKFRKHLNDLQSSQIRCNNTPSKISLRTLENS